MEQELDPPTRTSGSPIEGKGGHLRGTGTGAKRKSQRGSRKRAPRKNRPTKEDRLGVRGGEGSGGEGRAAEERGMDGKGGGREGMGDLGGGGLREEVRGGELRAAMGRERGRGEERRGASDRQPGGTVKVQPALHPLLETQLSGEYSSGQDSEESLDFGEGEGRGEDLETMLALLDLEGEDSLREEDLDDIVERLAQLEVEEPGFFGGSSQFRDLLLLQFQMDREAAASDGSLTPPPGYKRERAWAAGEEVGREREGLEGERDGGREQG
eukprot:CAMPEP_0181298654 /NCGR_PEP_ID=MMETSP1101-20121128/5903_1 /TAXON_ID=46948 /ORGANISM="Rhodomonas abbreviata, Strain Caron Lab Isolate" /LENGTH=268 /DNA_ID=CAMNT_0023403701 /DNA_START=656 /DNA_END=1459 /DNA_ORIENTATION=-